MKDVYQDDVILAYLSSSIRDACKKYTLSKMNEDDFLLLKDAYEGYPKEVTVVVVKGKKKLLHTVKRSCEDKYNTIYEKKLLKIIDKII